MSDKLKARAFEWLRNEALYGTEARYAEVMLKEIAAMKAAPRPEADAMPKAFATMPAGILTRAKKHASSHHSELTYRDATWLAELLDELTRIGGPSMPSKEKS